MSSWRDFILIVVNFVYLIHQILKTSSISSIWCIEITKQSARIIFLVVWVTSAKLNRRRVSCLFREFENRLVDIWLSAENGLGTPISRTARGRLMSAHCRVNCPTNVEQFNVSRMNKARVCLNLQARNPRNWTQGDNCTIWLGVWRPTQTYSIFSTQQWCRTISSRKKIKRSFTLYIQ